MFIDNRQDRLTSSFRSVMGKNQRASCFYLELPKELGREI